MPLGRAAAMTPSAPSLMSTPGRFCIMRVTSRRVPPTNSGWATMAFAMSRDGRTGSGARAAVGPGQADQRKRVGRGSTAVDPDPVDRFAGHGLHVVGDGLLQGMILSAR